MKKFQITKLSDINSNKVKYSFSFESYQILTITIDTKIITNSRYPSQTFEIYIEDFAFDFNILLVNADNSLTNISSSNIKYLTFHSSSHLNIH